MIIDETGYIMTGTVTQTPTNVFQVGMVENQEYQME
jgi:hypothetical protein